MSFEHKKLQAERRSVTRLIAAGGLACVGTDDRTVSKFNFMPENDIKDTKIMFLGQLEDKLWSKTKIWQTCNT